MKIFQFSFFEIFEDFIPIYDREGSVVVGAFFNNHG